MQLFPCSTGILFLIAWGLLENEFHFISGIFKETAPSVKENQIFLWSQRQKCFSWITLSLLKITLSQCLRSNHTSKSPRLRELFKWNMQKYSWLLSHEYVILWIQPFSLFVCLLSFYPYLIIHPLQTILVIMVYC